MDSIDATLPQPLIEELTSALSNMSYGSIELIVQDKIVTQITVRNIKKTSVKMKQKVNHNHLTATPLKNRISTSGRIQIKLRP